MVSMLTATLFGGVTHFSRPCRHLKFWPGPLSGTERGPLRQKSDVLTTQLSCQGVFTVYFFVSFGIR